MQTHERCADYLKRAEQARALAACASSFVAMDELLDVAAAWRALAAEAARITAPAPVVKVERPRSRHIRLVAAQEKTNAA